MNDAHKQIVRETCKSHTTKGTEREFGRTCPSKLTKRELEDLYFAILDNNLELKQTINAQNEKIKLLSTKVQRLSATQKAGLGKIEKDCCSSTKALIREQKDIIAEQKRANDRLTERNRILNMRLCSAKQFLGKNSARCSKCCFANNTLVKNTSTSAVNISTKRSASSIQEMVSNTEPTKEPVLVKSTEVQCENSERTCDENRCRTLMEELKQKIVALEEELSKTHDEYVSRVSRLEQEVERLQRREAEKRTAQQQGDQHAEQLLQTLRAAQSQCEDMKFQLSMERRKVSELETRLRAADVSALVARTIEEHLRNHKTKLQAPGSPMDTARCERIEGVEMKCSTPNGSAQASDTSTNAPQKHKHSDDSGYVEAVMLDDRKSSGKEVNSELREKILDLQTQLNTLQRLAAVEKDAEKKMPNFESYDQAIEEDQVSMLRNINDHDSAKNERPFNLDSLKLGGVYEIKKPESYILQERREESFNEKVVEPSTLPPAQVPKSRLNTPISRGILEKPDEYYKTHKKDEKMAKTVSYEDIIFNPPHKENMRNVLTKTEERSDLQMVGYSPSDEKHFDDAANKRTNDNICINEQSESKDSSHKPDKLQTCDFASDKPQKTFKEHKKTPRSLNANRIYSKDEGKTNFYSEQTPRDSKKIGIDIPETERLPTKEATDLTPKTVPNVPNIEIVKSDSSNKIVPADEIISRAPCIIPVTDKDEIKVIKDVRSVSDINLTKADVNGGRKEKMREEDISKDKDVRKTSDQKKKNAKKLEVCACFARICTCPRAPRRDVTVFRTCSGTSRFQTVPCADQTFRQCSCRPKHKHKDENLSCGSPTHESSRPSSGNTYVVKAEAALQRCARAGSPQDTDGEISGLTDLPDEREASPRSILSPGEEKPTSTYTETYTSTADYITLSEGELPVAVSGKAPMSPGERSWKNSTGEITPPRATSQKMEEALKAISEELARCRYLLQHQRPQRTSSKDVSSMTETEAIVLRKSDAQARMVPSQAQACCFTLHIGTIVLSDQAVTCSRGKSLILVWRFYNRNSAMTRMNPGRVVHFDFTTEYQMPLTDHFLEYLKNEDMTLNICELEKPSEVFASCCLPLRDALSHANRRADMSLALVAGPEMLSSRVVTDALDSGEEVGVLDVWCLLKIETTLIPSPRKIASKLPSVTITPPADDQTSVYHLTHDLEAKMKQHSKTHKRISGLVSNETFTMRSAQDVRQAVANEIRSTNRIRVRDMSDSNTIYSLLKNKRWRASSTKISNGQKKSVTIGVDQDRAQLVEDPIKDASSVITDLGSEDQFRNQTLDITVLWLALDDECEAISNPNVQRLYVAYSFLGRDGAELETPVSLPKPTSYTDKCYFNFNKKFQLNECDLPLLGHMAKCRHRNSGTPGSRDCVTFSVVSEPPEDPLGLDTCKDIGYAYLYLGDVLARSEGSDSYTEVLTVRSSRSEAVSGVLAVRVAGLQILRRL